MGPIDFDIEGLMKGVFLVGAVTGAAVASGIYFSYRCCTKTRPQPRKEEFFEETPLNLKQISRQDAQAARRRHSAPP